MTDKTGLIVILAGGMSSRMKKSADSFAGSTFGDSALRLPKAMLPVGKNGEPFLNLLLKNISKAGYRETVIVVNENDYTIRDYYGAKFKSQFLELNLNYAVQKIPTERSKPWGTADALECALRLKDDWRGKNFTVCNADNLYSVQALQTLLHAESANTIMDYSRDALEFPTEKILKFALIKSDEDEFLQDIIEKPDKSASREMKLKGRVGVSMNLWKFNYDSILPFLENTPLNQKRGEKEIPTAVKMMIDSGTAKVKCISIAEHVPDLTDINDFIKLKKYISELAEQ